MRLLTNRLSDQLLRRLLANLTWWRDVSRYCNQLWWSVLWWSVVQRRQKLANVSCLQTADAHDFVNESIGREWKVTEINKHNFRGAPLPDLVTWGSWWWSRSLRLDSSLQLRASQKDGTLFGNEHQEEIFLWEKFRSDFSAALESTRLCLVNCALH